MKNVNSRSSIEQCAAEFERILQIIDGLGQMSNVVPFLTKYAIIRACGTIEYCFKTIISDLHAGNSLQVQNYIDNTIRNSSMNPSMTNIYKTLNKFDYSWNNNFKKRLKQHPDFTRIKYSIDSLNTARNSFAHGNSTSSSFDSIRNYFQDCIILLEILDDVVSE
jgi:hypothetical protein